MQINNAITLLSNASATGASFNWKGGKGLFMAEATWGGGTVKLTFTSLHGTEIDVKNPAGTAVSLTANGMVYFELPPGQITANVATATAVYAYAIGIHQ
jgi:hypothetical protein